MSRASLVKLIGLAVSMLAVHAVVSSRLGTENDQIINNFMPVELIFYAAAVFVVLRDDGGDARVTGRAVAFIVGFGVLLRVMLIPIDPVSTDINRYIWDGRVQAAGINPYRYVPADPALQTLRDDDIYPEINRKDYAPTIYPPFAQIVFYLVTRYDEDVTVMKAVMTAFDVVTILALMRLLKARAIPPTRILIYAWHPVPVWEFAGDGHVDAVAVACLCASLLAAETRRPVLAGIALAGATLTKFFPVIIGPALYRRWDWKLPLAGFVTLVLLYLPYIGAGRKLLGFLAGYSVEEGFKDGSGLYPWLLLKHLFPVLPPGAFALYMPLLVLILVAIGLWSVFRPHRPGADIAGAFLIATTFTALTSPHYIWYIAWLVPFLCFYQSWAVFWLTGAATFMNDVHWPNDFAGGSLVFLPFFALALRDVTSCYLRTKGKHDGLAVAA